MPFVDRGFPVDVTFSSCQTDPEGTAGRRERQEKRRRSRSVDLRRERWSVSFPKGLPSFPWWTSSSNAELPTSYHRVPRKVRGEEWMDSNGAEEGTWGLNGGHASTRWARAQQGPMQEGGFCLHPVATPHPTGESPKCCSHGSALPPSPALKNRQDGTILGQLRKV